jgi:hypothetical protein
MPTGRFKILHYLALHFELGALMTDLLLLPNFISYSPEAVFLVMFDPSMNKL